jgi:hypothetical protein
MTGMAGVLSLPGAVGVDRNEGRAGATKLHPEKPMVARAYA